MTHKVLAACAVLSGVLVARGAAAQTQFVGQPDSPSWLKDRQYNEGIGIRAGDFEMHPGVAGEAGYDSNWLLRSTRQGVINGPPAAPVIPSLAFRETISWTMSTAQSPQRTESEVTAAPNYAFHFGFNATWRQFIGLSSDSTGSNDISQQNSGVPSIGADLHLDILPGHPVGVALFANYARVVQPSLTTTDPNISFNRDDIGGGGELTIQPGSGTLDWHFGYQLRTELFEDAQNGFNATGLDNLTNQIYTRGRWRFRPRTALMYDATLGFITYTKPNLALDQGLVNSTPVRARIGLNGLITNRFAALALVGWGSSFYDNSHFSAPQYDSLTAQAELKWFLAASPGIAALSDVGLSLSTLAVGYTRDFQNSYLGNYYGSDRGYLQFTYFFAGRMLMTLEGGVGAVEYPTILWSDGSLRHNPFTDTRVDGTLFAEYRFSNTFGLNATARYTANISSVHDMPDVQGPAVTGMPNNSNVFDMAWNRFELFLGLRWFM